MKDKATATWTDEVPVKADAGDAYYFVRRNDKLDVVIMGFSMGKGWLNGVSYDASEMRNHLFLGPVTPDRFTDGPQGNAVGPEAQEIETRLGVLPLSLIDEIDTRRETLYKGFEYLRNPESAMNMKTDLDYLRAIVAALLLQEGKKTGDVPL